MQQQTNLHSGVRAEPRFLRDPTSFESLSSGLSRLSSYVASNLPKRRSSFPFNEASQAPYLYQQQRQQPPSPPAQLTKQDKSEDEDGPDKPTFATFQSIESRNKDATARLCLLLGYQDGFQVWDVSNPDNVHEICSVRDKAEQGYVSYLHILENGRNDRQDPLLAVVMTKDSEEVETNSHDRRDSGSSIRSNYVTSQTSILRIYSLAKHEFIKEFPTFYVDEDPARITCVKSSSIAIVLGCISCYKSALMVLNREDFNQLSGPITDVYHDPATGPIFALGSRYIAYGTNATVVNKDPVMGQSKGIGSLGVLQGDKDVKGAAKDIAKEVVSGVKTLGEYGYQRLSNYFSSSNPLMMDATKISPGSMPFSGTASPPAAGLPVTTRSDDRIASPIMPSNTLSASSSSSKKASPAGMIMIRDVAKLSNLPQRSSATSVEAHFRPHTHPLSCLAFNSAGTLLLSASKQGHTFHVFALMPSLHFSGNVSHLYSLSRGYTDAMVEDCQFSADSMWCAVTTARGTSHVYAINPYGGKPDIIGHVTGRINNPLIRPWGNYRRMDQSTSLGSVVRIKQRRPVQVEAQEDPSAMTAYPIQSFYHPPSQASQVHPSRSAHVKLATAFLHPARPPYLLHGNKPIRSQSLSSATSLDSLKQHASTGFNAMLSSLGSSINTSDTSQSNRSQHAWISANDKANDNRLFGFDEEESSSALEDEYKLHSDDTVGYQDMYSIHPEGILTLHRCWVTKSTVKKREHTRVVEKIDLNVKQEDIAEWAVARKTDWKEVKIAFPEGTELTKRHRPWLSFAEINTYPSYEIPLWAYTQFSFQTFTKHDKELEEALWNQDEIPPTEIVSVRLNMPEPYSSRIDRVNKTMTRTANQGEENLDDACAELEDNISKAMQTMFPTPSPTGFSYGSSPSGYKRLSSSAGAHSLQQPLVPGGHIARSSPSTISFEDAHLINMGSGPSPEDLLLLDSRFNAANFRPTTMHGSSLIQFDDDEQDIPPTHGEEEGVADQLFSPDGDNEVAHPSESILAEKIPREDL